LSLLGLFGGREPCEPAKQTKFTSSLLCQESQDGVNFGSFGVTTTTVLPWNLAQAGKVPRCRAERFFQVQVNTSQRRRSLAAAPGARDSQQGGFCRRTPATTLVGGDAAHACRLNTCVKHHVELAVVRMLTMSLDN
jgi:hypothetical protein